MLAYGRDVSAPRFRNLLRKELEALCGVRVQTIFMCLRERSTSRIAAQIPEGDIRLIPMDRSVWEQQMILSGELSQPTERPFPLWLLI